MNIIRSMVAADKNAVLEMMRVFYASPTVLSNGSEEIFEADFENCINDNPYLEGYVFTDGDALQEYAMVAKSFLPNLESPVSGSRICMCRRIFAGRELAAHF